MSVSGCSSTAPFICDGTSLYCILVSIQVKGHHTLKMPSIHLTNYLAVHSCLKANFNLTCIQYNYIFTPHTDDLLMPKSLQCGGFQKMLEDVVVWLSSGGTKSVLHYDFVDNINCLLDGTKRVTLIDKVMCTVCWVAQKSPH